MVDDLRAAPSRTPSASCQRCSLEGLRESCVPLSSNPESCLQSEFGAETMEIPEESIVHVTQRVKIGFRRLVCQRPRYLESVGKGPKAFFDYYVSIIPTRNFSTRAYRVLN
jgi:hypothetical protein